MKKLQLSSRTIFRLMIVTPIIATVLVFVISALVKIYKTDRQPEASGEDMQLEAVNEWMKENGEPASAVGFIRLEHIDYAGMFLDPAYAYEASRYKLLNKASGFVSMSEKARKLDYDMTVQYLNEMEDIPEKELVKELTVWQKRFLKKVSEKDTAELTRQIKESRARLDSLSLGQADIATYHCKDTLQQDVYYKFIIPEGKDTLIYLSKYLDKKEPIAE